MLKSKIHRACVTQADLDYEGSITISPELLKAANILPYEAVNVWNITAGTRFETYAITGEKGSTDICVNGAAAHLVTPVIWSLSPLLRKFWKRIVRHMNPLWFLLINSIV